MLANCNVINHEAYSRPTFSGLISSLLARCLVASYGSGIDRTYVEDMLDRAFVYRVYWFLFASGYLTSVVLMIKSHDNRGNVHIRSYVKVVSVLHVTCLIADASIAIGRALSRPE